MCNYVVLAIWLYPSESACGGWPCSSEIDIMETARDMPQTGGFGFGMTVTCMIMVACAVLQSLDGGRHSILAVVGEMAPDARAICVAWSGSHWQRARVTQVGRRQVQAWWHAR